MSIDPLIPSLQVGSSWFCRNIWDADGAMKFGLHCLNPNPLWPPCALRTLSLTLAPELDDELIFILSPVLYKVLELKYISEYKTWISIRAMICTIGQMLHFFLWNLNCCLCKITTQTFLTYLSCFQPQESEVHSSALHLNFASSSLLVVQDLYFRISI